MFVEVKPSHYQGLNDITVSHINTDYIVSVRKETDSFLLWATVRMSNGDTYTVDEESYKRLSKILKLK